MTDRSVSQDVTVNCPHCGRGFDAPVWLVVDTPARPELLRRTRAGTIHALRCPSCFAGVVGVAAPVVLFREDAALKVITVIPEEMAPADIGRVVSAVVGMLRARVGEGWDERWMQESAGSVLARSAERFIDEEWEDVPFYGAGDPVLRALHQLLAAGDATGWEEAVRNGPELLDDSVRTLLAGVRADAHETRPQHAARTDAALDFVDRCRTDGLDAARAAAPPRQLRAAGAGLDAGTLQLLMQLLGSDRSLDTSGGIVLAEQVIARLDPATDRVMWALVQGKLGGLLRQNTTGDRAASIERSVAAYDAALAAVTPDDAEVWGSTMAGKAQSLQERLTGDRGENYERAIEICEDALRRVADAPATQAVRGALFDALGSALVDRPRGDRIDNIERAIEAFGDALATLPEPLGRGMFLNNLARALAIRMRGDVRENLTAAIAAYEESLGILAADPDGAADYPLGAMNVGVAYLNRDPGNADDTEAAIRWLGVALAAYPAATAPREWARTVMNLATAYANRQTGNHADNIRTAVGHLEDATAAFTEWNQPLDLARARWNLATLVSTDATGTPHFDLRRAAALLEEVLEVFTPETDAVECRRAAARLGDLRMRLGKRTAALRAYEIGVAAAESLYRRSYVPANQRVELEINAEVYDRCVGLCVEIGTPELRRRGLLYAEAGRGRQFLDQMGVATLPPPPGVDESLVAREAMFLQRLRSIEVALAAPTLAPDQERELASRRVETRRSLLELWTGFESQGPGAREYVAMRRGDSPGWEDLATLATKLGKDSALVSLYVLEDEIEVFLLRAGWKSPRVHRCPVTRDELTNRYLRSFDEEVIGHVEFRESGGEPSHEWLALGRVLFEPVMPHLRGVRIAYLLPHAGLHRMPLHALTVEDEPLIARVAVAYAPSAAILQRTVARRRPTEGTRRAVVAAWAESDDPVRTEFEQEAGQIAACFDATPSIGADASIERLTPMLPGADVVHLACHGFFDVGDPLGSGLEIADGVFSARHWMSVRLDGASVTLSACDTGRLVASRGDELVGLTRSLLYAGASTAVVTLWRIFSDATLAWMVDFATRIRGAGGSDAQNAAIAFQDATLTLMAVDDDVVAWAPFVLIGDAQVVRG